MSENDYAIGILKKHLKDLYFFVKSIEVFQYYSATMDKSHPGMSSGQAKKYIAKLESAIKMIQKPEVTEEWIEEKAKMLVTFAYKITQHEPHIENHHFNKLKAKEFLRTLLGEIHGKEQVAEDWIQGEPYEDL